MGFQHLSQVHPGRDTQRRQDDVDRGPVLHERHVLFGEDLGDDALVAVPAGQLVTLGDLALLGHVDPDQFVDTRRKVETLGPLEDLDGDDLARLAVGHLQRGVADLPRLLTEDGPQQALLGRQFGLTLGGDLADQIVARADFGADADDPVLVEVGEDLLGHIGDVPGDLLGAQLGVAGVDLVLLDVDRGEHVLFDEPLGDDDGVLEVVTLPRHERHQQVPAQGQFAGFGRGAVGEHLAGLDLVTLPDQRLLVDAGALVRALELVEPHRVLLVGVLLLDDDVIAGDLDHFSGHGREDHVARVAGGPGLDAGADQRGIGLEQRHRLALHVRAHQGPVGVVVLEEGDQGGRNRDDLLRRDIHVVDFLRRDRVDLAPAPGPANQDPGIAEGAVLLDRGVGLGDDVALLFDGGEVVDLGGHLAVDDLAVGSLDEAEPVDPGVGRQRADQADVGTFRRLDRAHPSVVGGVHVTNLEPGTLAGQASGARGPTGGGDG